MAALAHLGVGLAASRAVPQVPAGYLILGAYALDVVWTGFYLAGIETFPKAGVVPMIAWSHGLFMAIVWSALAGLLTARLARNKRTAVVIALLVFSHWVVDFITHPMTAFFPGDRGLPLLFAGSPEIGLGLYRDRTIANICEYGSAAAGLAVYVLTRRRVHRLESLAGKPVPMQAEGLLH